MGNYDNRRRALLRADTGDLRQLALIAGGNPKTFYIGTDISDLELKGQDLHGMDFGEKQNAKLILRILEDLNATGKISKLDQLYLRESEQFKVTIAALNARAQSIYLMRLGLEKPHTLAEIGSKFGVTRERIRQIQAKLFRALRNYLNLTIEGTISGAPPPPKDK